MKLNKKLVDQLAKGEIAVINDGSSEQLKEVLRHAFPKDNYKPKEDVDFYASRLYDKDCWGFGNPQDLKKVSISKFYEMEKEIIGYKLIKPEYLNAVCSIVGPWFKIDSMIQMGSHIYDLEQSGLLALWFKPIYEEETFKFGDVAFRSLSSDIESSHHKRGRVFEVYKVDGAMLLEKWKDKCTHGAVMCRHATPEEKEKYLLDKANREYPIGTEYKCAWSNQKGESYGVFCFSDEGEITNTESRFIRSNGKWAEKIENKLPTIGGVKGIETKSHIKYGNKNLSKKCLRQMEAFGITRIMVATEEYSIVSETELSELYKAAKK